MKFNYQARTKTGEMKTGVVEAATKDGASEILKNYGFFVTALEEVSAPFYAKELKIFSHVTNKDLVSFSRQLAVMFKSRIPLVEIFQSIARQTRNSSFQEKITKISQAIEGGTSLSEALSMYPKLFSNFYVSMVRSGEASGKLTDVFTYLAGYLEREFNFKSKIRLALAYPGFVVFVFVLVAFLIINFVIPQLASVLQESNQQLPWITTLVINTSVVLKNFGFFIILIMVLIVAGIIYLSRTEKGKKFFDRNLLLVPFLGTFLKQLYIARVARNLSTLISGGLPISQALDITSQVVGNDVYRSIILEAKDGVQRGETMSSIFEKYPKYIFAFFFQMISVGEKTGTLDSSLTNVVDFYEGDADRALDAFVKMIEPVLIIVLGLIVAGLMASVLLPLYSFNY